MSRALQANKLDAVTRACAAFIGALERQSKLQGRITDAAATVVVIDTTELTAKIDERLARLAPPSATIEHDAND